MIGPTKIKMTFFTLFVFSMLTNSSLANESIWNVKRLTSQEVTILNDGPAALAKRIKLVREAKKSIELEYFIYNTDSAGKLLTHELLKKAKEGVRVRLLLDNFLAGIEINPFYAHELKKSGIEVRYYNIKPFADWDSNYRNHRKIFIVDGKHVITGGRNIADEYFDMDERYNFLDRDIYIKGETAQDVLITFNEYWNSAPSKIVPRPTKPMMDSLELMRGGNSNRSFILKKYKTKLRAWKKSIVKARLFLKRKKNDDEKLEKILGIGFRTLESSPSGTCSSVLMSSDRPLPGAWGDSRRVLRHEIYRRMNQVQKELLVSSPYFIMTDKTNELFRNILERGISVSLLTNGMYSTDALPVAAVFNHYLKDWLKLGLKPSVFSGFFIEGKEAMSEEVRQSRWGVHSKTIVFDDDHFMIGSYNFDPRSAYYSAEMSVFCEGEKDLTSSLADNIRMRMKNSVTFKTEEDARKHEFDNVSLLKKMGYYFMKPISLLFKWVL